MAQFIYERVDPQLHEACVVMTPLPLKGLRTLPPQYLMLPNEDDYEGEKAELREVGAFNSDETATLFFVKYLAKLSEPSWRVFPCYVGPDRKFQRYVQL